MEVDIEATGWFCCFMEVDIEATTDSFRMVAGFEATTDMDGCCFMDIEATTDSFRMVAVLWRWILKRQPIVLGWLLFYGGGY